MKVRQWIIIGAAVLLATAAWSAGQAMAVEVSGRASTVVELYETPQGETAMPVYQYLRMNLKLKDTHPGATDAGSAAVDAANPDILVKIYGRVGHDVKKQAVADGRLYYAYLEKNDWADRLDLKVGRQFVATTAGASIMDGILLKFRKFDPVTFTLFSGGDVAYYKNYNANDLIMGGEAAGIYKDDLHYAFSYLQKWEDHSMSHELIGIDGDYEFRQMLNLYSEVQYNVINEGISYFLGGAKYHRNPKWFTRLEYLYSLPVFSTTSIYSVFAVNAYKEVLGEFNYQLAPGLRGFTRVSVEMYEETADAHVYEAGIEKIRTEHFSGYLSGVFRDDKDGQDLKGLKFHTAYLMTKSLQLGVGAHVDVLERRLDENDDETTSQMLWVDGTYYLNKKTSFEAKIERIESDLWDNYYRGRARLNILF